MKKINVLLLLFVAAIFNNAYTQTAAQLHETAKTFMRQGDYANAVLILNKSILKEPDNTSIGKDLALSYYYSQNNEKALETIKPVLESKDADDQCFLIAGNIYKQLNQPKESEKVYKKGIKNFPDSGPLYNELGEAQIANKNTDAIKSWEKGIKLDPSYSRNYFNAARYYYFNKNIVWSILYAEIFVNMDTKSPNIAEMKQLILDNYKTLFTETDLEKNNKEKNDFAKKYLIVMGKQSSQTMGGINAETLYMIRARFIIDWFADNNNPTFKLFDLQKKLLKDGMFEAYNQWLFGATENINAYENWIKANAEDNTQFVKYQSTTIFKIPTGQYYH